MKARKVSRETSSGGQSVDNLREQLSFLAWPPDDPRWTALHNYSERVRTAGLSLVSTADRDRLIERHLQPSLEGLDLIPPQARVLDIGSGGGFPALPIAIARPDLQITLIESNQRKSSFLTRVSRETGLVNTRVVGERVENLGHEHDQAYEIVTARAVAELPILLGWTRRFLADGGRFLLWKGQSWPSEGNLAELGVELIEERLLSDGGRLLVLVRLENGVKPAA